MIVVYLAGLLLAILSGIVVGLVIPDAVLLSALIATLDCLCRAWDKLFGGRR